MRGTHGRTRNSSPTFQPRQLLPAAFAAAAWILLFTRIPALFQRLACPFQVQQEEAVNVEFGRILLRGDTLYPDLTKGGPYIHCSYPPLFPFLESLLMRLTSDPWLPGRFLAFGGYLGCGLLLGWTAWRRWKSPAWALLLPALLWLFPTWALWGSMVRLDTCLLLLNFSSFLILWRSCEGVELKKRPLPAGELLAAGFLNALAVLLKPTALTLTLAFGLYAVLRRPGRKALFFFAGALLPVLLFLAAAQWETRGLYWTHTVKWAAVGLEWSRLGYFLSTSFPGEAGWVAAGVVLTLALRQVPLWPKCQALFAFLSIAALGREGSAENYYMEFLLYGLVIFGEGWAGSTGSKKNKPVQGWAGLVPALVLLAGLFNASRFPAPSFPSPVEMEAKRRMLSFYVKGERHLALDTDLPVMAGKRIWYQHSGILAIVRSGAWNPEPLLNDIREKKFSTTEIYDLPRQYLYPPGVEEAIRRHYHVSVRKYGRIWLEPNG